MVLKKSAAMAACALLLGSTAWTDSPPEEGWPRRVVITNDDGIGKPERLLPMAEAFSKIAETFVIVPSHDRSGSSTFLSWGSRKRALEVELELHRPASQESRALTVYSVDGYPADCVLFARGLLGDDPPDLVISGPNGGPNLGVSWMFSGTIGAARVAALLGLPAIAVSGVEDDWPEAVEAVADWTVKLAQSAIVRELEPGQFLTVGLPEKRPDQIRGVRVARRAPPMLSITLTKGPELTGDEDREVWLWQYPTSRAAPPPDTDAAIWGEDYVVITPMRADEHDEALLQRLLDGAGPAIPDWKD